MEFILSRSSTHASTPKHRVACHRHPSHREPFRRTGLIYLLGWRLSGVGTWWTITSQDEEDYEDDGNHGIILSTITSRRVHTGVRHSWSEESPEGTFPTICDLGRCPLQKVTRPSEIRSIVEQAHSSGCGGHVNSQMLAKKIMRQGPLLKVRVSRDVRNVNSFDLMEFSFKMLHHVEWRVHRLSPR